MPVKSKKIQFVYFIYWMLLAYIIAALVFWFIALMRQNVQMAAFKIERLNENAANYASQSAQINKEKKLKVAQYIGEGSTFLLLIVAGAIFVFRSVRRQLKQSQQQQHFMMAITHELKTPIAVTKLNLQTLKKRKLEPIQQEKLLSNTLQEADRLDALCSNLLVSSQIESGKYQLILDVVNLARICSEAVENAEQRYPNLIIKSNLQQDAEVRADANLLLIVLNNLLDNAYKYAAKEKPVFMSCSKIDDHCIILVEDCGPGISDDQKKHVFEKFYRTGNEATRSAKGTGLGLYISRKIIQEHKGTLHVRDNSNGGSTFCIRLKAHANA